MGVEGTRVIQEVAQGCNAFEDEESFGCTFGANEKGGMDAAIPYLWYTSSYGTQYWGLMAVNGR